MYCYVVLTYQFHKSNAGQLTARYFEILNSRGCVILQEAGLWLAHVDRCSQSQHALDDATGEHTKQFEKRYKHIALFLKSPFSFIVKTTKE